MKQGQIILAFGGYICFLIYATIAHPEWENIYTPLTPAVVAILTALYSKEQGKSTLKQSKEALAQTKAQYEYQIKQDDRSRAERFKFKEIETLEEVQQVLQKLLEFDLDQEKASSMEDYNELHAKRANYANTITTLIIPVFSLEYNSSTDQEDLIESDLKSKFEMIKFGDTPQISFRESVINDNSYYNKTLVRYNDNAFFFGVFMKLLSKAEGERKQEIFDNFIQKKIDFNSMNEDEIDNFNFRETESMLYCYCLEQTFSSILNARILELKSVLEAK